MTEYTTKQTRLSFKDYVEKYGNFANQFIEDFGILGMKVLSEKWLKRIIISEMEHEEIESEIHYYIDYDNACDNVLCGDYDWNKATFPDTKYPSSITDKEVDDLIYGILFEQIKYKPQSDILKDALREIYEYLGYYVMEYYCANDFGLKKDIPDKYFDNYDGNGYEYKKFSQEFLAKRH